MFRKFFFPFLMLVIAILLLGLLIGDVARVSAGPEVPGLRLVQDKEAGPQYSRQNSPLPVEQLVVQMAPRQIEIEGKSCSTIDFEGIGDLAEIPEFDGITSPGWLAIIDADDGGSGNFAHEPSPSTIAFWLGEPVHGRDILFQRPVSDVSFYYVSAVEVSVEAFDADGNLLDSARGPANGNLGPGGDPEGYFNQWDPIGVEADGNLIMRLRISGNVDQTGIDDLTVCSGIRIHSVEFTQAIQEWQGLEELQADLDKNGSPPIPIVAFKPAVLRVYFEPVDRVTEVWVRVEGAASDERGLILHPGCSVEQRRSGQNGCRSADFYFTPPRGAWSISLSTRDANGSPIESHTFNQISKRSDVLELKAVQVCSERIEHDSGLVTWNCAPREVLAELDGLLRAIAPTDRVRINVGTHSVRVNSSDYDLTGDGDADDCIQLPGGTVCEYFLWWNDMSDEVDALYNLFDSIASVFGVQKYYMGMVRSDAPGTVGGIAAGIPSHGAASRITVTRLGVETNEEVMTHETGHMLGLRHTNTDVPLAQDPDGDGENDPPGCYFLAQDSSTSWPYPDNLIQSGPAHDPQPEVGFDLANRIPIDPETTFELMSYCTPRWVSPQYYLEMLEVLDPPPPLPPGTRGPFWVISGSFFEAGLELDPLYKLEWAADPGQGSGSHRIEVRDASGNLLTTRWFTPATPIIESEPSEFVGVPAFHELVASQQGEARIIILDPQSNALADLALEGETPNVTILTPERDVEIAGSNEIRWLAEDEDSNGLIAWVLYSPDDGESWSSLASGITDTKLQVDYDLLPGSQGQALVRVLVSDGINSGEAISEFFSVSMKSPHAEIRFPKDHAIYAAGELIWLQGFAFDYDEELPENSAQWVSNRDGLLGIGHDLPVTSISPGSHLITLTVTDSAGNQTQDTITISVDDRPPRIDVQVIRDHIPTSCAYVTIEAEDDQAGSGLASVEYSLNGGQTWQAIPISSIPHHFITPGTGFFHLVARTTDKAGNFSAADLKYFVGYACENQSNQPPSADAGGPYAVDEGSIFFLDASNSFDVDNNIQSYLWDLDNDGEFDDASGVNPQMHAVDDGVILVAVLVTDTLGAFDIANAEVTVSNLPPAIESLQDTTIHPWGAFELEFHFSDPGYLDSHSCVVDWGDETSSAAALHPGDYFHTGMATHVYRMPGDYLVQIIVEDDDGGVAMTTLTVVVDLAPSTPGVFTATRESAFLNLTHSLGTLGAAEWRWRNHIGPPEKFWIYQARAGEWLFFFQATPGDLPVFDPQKKPDIWSNRLALAVPREKFMGWFWCGISLYDGHQRYMGNGCHPDWGPPPYGNGELHPWYQERISESAPHVMNILEATFAP